MKGYQPEEAAAYILAHMDHKPFRAIEKQLSQIIRDFIDYDLHFMKLTGVLDENGEQGDNEYDDDEAFEYIYDAWLSDHPETDDDDMKIAALLDEYMQWQYRYLDQQGLTDV